VKKMPVFAYEAVDKQGRKLKDQLEAANKQDARNKIQALGYFPSSIQESSAARRRGAQPSLMRLGAA